MRERHPFEWMTEPQLGALLEKIARMVQAELPPGTLFCLVTFGFGEKGDLGQYISNGDRPGMIKAMREMADEMADDLEQQRDVPR